MTDTRTAEITHYRALCAVNDAHSVAIERLQDDLSEAEYRERALVTKIARLEVALDAALARESALADRLDALNPPF